MAADASRLVDVRATLPPDAQGNVSQEIGSGLLVTDDLVLTAAHVVFDEDDRLPVTLRFPASDTTVEGTVVWPERRSDTDAALVRLTGPARPARTGRPPRFGRFTGREARQPVDATGFPRVMREGSSRVSYQLAGHVNPQGALRAGRYLLSVDDPPADPGKGRPSPWAGMSGAAAMSGGAVVGVVVIDTPGFDRDVLTVVPAAEVAADRAARELLGLSGSLVSVELDPLLSRPALSHGRLSPAQLLRADEEVIPFQGRANELEDLREWCTSGEEFGARLIAGPGGRGKTRLAQALVEETEQADGQWISGLLSSRIAFHSNLGAVMSTAREHPVLLVADYAESRADQLDQLLQDYEAADNPPRLRLLLLARDRGEWWDRLSDRHDALLGDAAFLSLPPLHPLWDRDAAFASSVQHFASRLAVMHPGADWQAIAQAIGSRDLREERFGDPLALQLEALLALLESAGSAGPPGAPEQRLIAHEREYWRNTLEAEGIDLTPQLRDQAVAAATLIAARDRAGAVALLQRVPELTNPGPVATWLRSLYPTETQSRYWGPLQPDRLGEHHIGAVTRADPSLLPHLLGSDDVNELQEALVIIGRAMAHQPHLLDQLSELLRVGPPVLAQAADLAVDRVANPLPLLRSLPASVGQRYTLDPDDYGSVSSWGHESSVPEKLSEIGRGIGENPYTSSHPLQSEPEEPGAVTEPSGGWRDLPPAPTAPVDRGREHERLATQAYERGNLVLAALEFASAVSAFRDPPVSPEHLTRALLGQAAALNDQRLFPQASAAIDEAVSILGSEVASGTIPADVLGRARDLQGGILAEMGELERALSVGYDAVHILREVDSGQAASWESRRDYAKAVSNLAGLLQRMGRAREATSLSHEAVSLFESLRHEGHIGPNDATYGRVILGNARIMATAKGPEGALEQVAQAIAEFERIGDIDADSRRAMAPELASAHTLRSVLHSQLGDRDQAIASGLEAVAAYTELADLRPGFLPDLATSLVNVAKLRLEAGEAAAAVEGAQRAVGLLHSVLRGATEAGTAPSASLTRFLVSAEDTLRRARSAVWTKESGPPAAVGP